MSAPFPAYCIVDGRAIRPFTTLQAVAIAIELERCGRLLQMSDDMCVWGAAEDEERQSIGVRYLALGSSQEKPVIDESRIVFTKGEMSETLKTEIREAIRRRKRAA